MAIAEQDLRVRISVLDLATEKLRAINERIERFSAPLRRIRARFAELGEETGLKEIGEHAREARERVERLHGGLSGLLPALGGLGALLGLREFAEAIRASAEFDEHLALTARAAGLTATQLGGLEAAGKIAGVSIDQLDRGVQYLNRNIAEAARGKAKDVEMLLGRMGLSNAPGHLLNTSAALAAVADEAKHLVDTGQVQLAADMMSKLFGSRSGVLLLPMFQQGSAHLKELMEEAAEYGLAPSDAAAATGLAFNESMKHMDMAVLGLRNTIADKLFPVLTPVVEKMADWVKNNREWIATDIAREIKQFIDLVRAIDWTPALTGLRMLGNGALWAMQHLRLIEIVLGVIAAQRLIGTVAAIGSVGAAVVAAGARMAAALWSVGAAARVAVGSTGIGLLLIAAYEIYEHWDAIEPWIEGVLRKLVDFSGWAWGQIRDQAGPAIDWIWNKWKAFADWLTTHLPSWLTDSWTGGSTGTGGAAGASRTAPGEGPISGGRAAGPLSGERADLARRLVAEAQARGLDQAHALALVGNAFAESGLNPAALGDYQNGIPTSFGLFQEHDSRMRDMLTALGSRAKDPLAQLDYAIDEMRRRDPGWFNRTADQRDLTNDFERSFERPRDVVDRGSFADRIAGALATPIGRPAAPAAPKGKLDVNVRIDHRNPPPGTTARAGTEGSGDYEFGDLGQAFVY